MSHRDPVDVLHSVLLASEGGISAAAKTVGRSPGVLHNKFAESMPHYEVTVREALALARWAKTTAFAEAVCEQFGGTFLPLPEGMPGDDDVLQSYLSIIERMGDLSREFTEARSDGVIEQAEFDAIKLRASRTISAIAHMVNDLAQLVREVPPTSSLKKVAG